MNGKGDDMTPAEVPSWLAERYMFLAIEKGIELAKAGEYPLSETKWDYAKLLAIRFLEEVKDEPARLARRARRSQAGKDAYARRKAREKRNELATPNNSGV